MKTALKRRANSSSTANEKDIGPYANEPVADEEWLANYREKRQKYDERLKELQRRLDIWFGRIE